MKKEELFKLEDFLKSEDEKLYEFVDELKKQISYLKKSRIKKEMLEFLADQFDLNLMPKGLFAKCIKREQGITLKEFVTECTKLGVLVNQFNDKWTLRFRGCNIATIDPLNECVMLTDKLFYKIPLRYELFELLTNLAYTCKEDRHIEDFFEEDKNETI